jgi:Leucine carboxyl methyltransferase
LALTPARRHNSASSVAGGIVLEAGRPSVTAQGAAIQRAAHQLLEAPRVFDDPLALAMIGTDAEATLRADLAAYQTPYRRRQRANIAARSRHAEDALAKAQRQGVRQYVLLGARLDSFAYRPGTEESGLRVFEVDYPATQAWKRGRSGSSRMTRHQGGQSTGTGGFATVWFRGDGCKTRVSALTAGRGTRARSGARAHGKDSGRKKPSMA